LLHDSLRTSIGSYPSPGLTHPRPLSDAPGLRHDASVVKENQSL
jgi:hypothetical protein